MQTETNAATDVAADAAMRCRANLRSIEGATVASNYIANAIYWARVAWRNAELVEVNS